MAGVEPQIILKMFDASGVINIRVRLNYLNLNESFNEMTDFNLGRMVDNWKMMGTYIAYACIRRGLSYM